MMPLRFEPVFREYLWGGRRLATRFHKPIGDGDHYAESWEVVDHGPDQSVVAAGPHAGMTLGRLVQDHGEELLGSHHPQSRFPLLFKLLDAQKNLSVQVHPNDEQAARLDPPDLGKTEAWVVLHAEPESLIYAGLKRGFDRPAFEREVRRGTTELCLHRFHPRVGDCILIPAGVVHALGAGLVLAEIQQASDTTFRLYDWNRVDAEGRPRALHIEQALDVIDYERGPVEPHAPRPTDQPHIERLVECEKFVLRRWSLDEPRSLGGDDRFHILWVQEGRVQVSGDPSGQPLDHGQTLLLPAAAGPTTVEPLVPSRLLEMHLP